jgi:thiol-disulfide isomerase/thioredoxin
MPLKQFLPFAFIGIATTSMAQSDVGINFIKADSWEAVVAKAKTENKYIFLDAYTTWCGPCIMMDKMIFPLPEVGAFYNANFINVKVQLDTTANDHEDVKKWYADGHMLAKKYTISAYPTYIFFSPDGEAVHRAVGSSDAETFINKGKDALIPDKQYYSLAAGFEKGNRDPVFLRKLILAAQNNYDRQNLPAYARAFYKAEKDLLAKENIKLLVDLTESPSDTGFYLMVKYPEKFNEELGQPYAAERKLMSVIMAQEVFPYLSEGKELVKIDPDWSKMQSELTNKYSTLGAMACLNGKAMYYRAKSDYVQFSEAVSALMENHEKIMEAEMLNEYAWNIFEDIDDIQCIKRALSWSKKSIEKNNDPNFLDTYANLLHKSGNTRDAIVWQKKAIALMKEQGEDTESLEETLAKMEKGEKTWN